MQAQFEMWSPFHYFMMIFPFVLAAVLYKMTQKKTFAVKRRVAIVLGIILVLILAARQIYIFNNDGLGPEVFPFQVCHFANILLLIVAINPNLRVTAAIAWCLNVPAGLVSVVFADGLENYSNVLNTQGLAYISGHMLIVTTGLYLLLTRMIQIDWRELLKAYEVLAVLYVLSVVVNNWFVAIFDEKSNYFYSYAPEAGTPLEDLYNLGSTIEAFGLTFNPVYLLSLAVVGAAVMFLMYLLAKLRYIKHDSSVQRKLAN
ncbi:Integral membrane protein (intg_mem_TP0381) [Alkalibacterium putridalgicola]|uniref:Integral membrane protein (Intg_mem_TP0381) n=1 Tax=Alkalibacterium putridalgicola TaxID=426703 RepID=A0A1H7WGL2_9LACT|nr:YwaF family protein [Alkalibacterium putridalgicola]GEK90025.1 hypothetical protein APU01nite_20640 [Alkalibacterium putridalgicola]SEM20696.1 Integral membrane protein (intg_mem_TP0381) [Alkalibacterium putridalgicola]